MHSVGDEDEPSVDHTERYPAGLQAKSHRHTAAHTIIVLDGAMQLDGQLLEPGSYAHRPGETVMHHAPATGRHCLFVIIFHGPFDVIAVDTIGKQVTGRREHV